MHILLEYARACDTELDPFKYYTLLACVPVNIFTSFPCSFVKAYVNKYKGKHTYIFFKSVKFKKVCTTERYGDAIIVV